MKRIILTFGLVLTGLALFGQSPRIRLNQITKDSLTGSVVLSGSDSNMVYSRDFFLNFQDSVLIVFGDTLSTTATAFSGVTTDLTLTGNGTVGTPLKVDTAIIATVSALADSLAGIISSVTTDLTLTGDGSVATPLKVDTAVIATIKALADSVATRGTVSSVAVSGGTGISVSGSPITTSGTITVTNTAPDQTVALTGGTGITTSGTYPNFTITNSAPDQTVSITGAGINAVTGTYPNFTITGTEVDGSLINEGTLGVSAGTASTSVITSNTSGANGVTITAAGINSISESTSSNGGTITITATEVDGSVTNEGSLSVGAGGANSSDIISNTSGSTNVTIAGGTGINVTEAGSTITIAATGGGGSFNNLSENGDTVIVAKDFLVDTTTFFVDAVNNRVGIGQTQTLTGSALTVRGSIHIVDADTTSISDNQMYIFPKEQTTAGANSSEFQISVAGPGSSNQNQGPAFIMRGNNYVRNPNQRGVIMFTAGRPDTTTATGLPLTGRDGQLNFISEMGEIHFNTGGFDDVRMLLKNNGDLKLYPATSGATPGNAMSWNSADSTIYFSTSSIRFKENIRDYDKGISTIMQMKPVYFNYLTSSQLEAGFIAEDIESIGLNEYTTKDGAGLIYGLRVGAFKPLIVKAIQEQQQIIETQQQEIETLKTQYNDLLQRIINLENK